MKDGKYRIINNYGGYDGMSWRNGADQRPLEFETIDAAMREALEHNQGCGVYIVRMVEPEA
jgi:hypothetical protein